MLSKAAKPGDQSSQMETLWTLGARPCSIEEDEQALMASLSHSILQYGSQQLQLAITHSDAWTPSDLAQLETLIQSRNRFVCMQLVTMVKEQYDKVKAAKAANDRTILLSARFMFLATITLSGSNEVVAAGLFYPRFCSKDQVEMPHMYVELLCCNSPGKGYGTVLLQHIEQFTAGCCDYISARFFGSPESTENSSLDCKSISQESSSPVAVAAGPLGGSSGISLSLVAMNEAVPAGGLAAGCCTACNSSGSCNMAVVPSALDASGRDKTSVAAGRVSTEVQAMALDNQATMSSSRHPSAEPIDIPQAVAATSAAFDDTVAIHSGNTGSSFGSETSFSCPIKRLQGIKLLSVGSAQSFYAQKGYGAPDVCKEMFKPLMSCSKKVGLCAVSSAASSCSSISTVSIC